MKIAIRILVLSTCISAYMIWAFRGVENDPREALSALLGFTAAFLLPTVLVVAVYAWRKGGGAGTAVLAWRCWLATAGLEVIGCLAWFARDTASGGYFRGNVLVGAGGLILLVAVLNFVLVQVVRHVAPDRG